MEPDELLRCYLQDICSWEAECARLHAESVAGRIEDSECHRVAAEQHGLIFEKFCSKSRALRRESLLSYSTPLNAPEAEKIIATRMVSVAEIETQQVAGRRKRHIYRLVLEEGKWKLFEKFIVTAGGELIRDEL